MGFIGRHAELETLSKALQSRKSAFISVSGRRRVGKSSLVLEFLKKNPGIYLTGKRAPSARILKEFMDQARRHFMAPEEDLAKSFQNAFEKINNLWRQRSNLILVFDDCCLTASACKDFTRALKKSWKEIWKPSNRVLLILVTSNESYLKKLRLTGHGVHLTPFDFQEACKFNPNYSLVDQAKTYFICGGIPYYLKSFSDSRSVETNIKNLILNPDGLLHQEPERLLQEDLREIGSYNALLAAAGAGHFTSKAMARHSGIHGRSLFYYFKKLEQMGYMGRAYPLKGKFKQIKQVNYRIKDPLFSFWYRFVFPQPSHIQDQGPQSILRRIIRPELMRYYGTCFETFCQEGLARWYKKEGIKAPFKIGAYWDKSLRIDLVGQREDGVTDLCCCSWGNAKSYKLLIRDLEQKAQAFPNTLGAKIQCRFLSRLKASASLKNSKKIQFACLEDLYGF